jgi:hypothetical protein
VRSREFPSRLSWNIGCVFDDTQAVDESISNAAIVFFGSHRGVWYGVISQETEL